MEIKMKEIKNILFFIKYIKPQWKTLLTVIVLTIVATGIGLYLPIINSNLVDKGILAKNFDYVLNISIIYTLSYLFMEQLHTKRFNIYVIH